MICRCSSATEHARREADSLRISHDSEVRYLKEQLAVFEADLTNFVIEEVEEINGCLLLQVRFQHKGETEPDCTFDGLKILVYEARTMKDAIKWRKIDPHFREEHPHDPHSAPSPTARFPGDDRGWIHAKAFAASTRGK